MKNVMVVSMWLGLICFTMNADAKKASLEKVMKTYLMITAQISSGALPKISTRHMKELSLVPAEYEKEVGAAISIWKKSKDIGSYRDGLRAISKPLARWVTKENVGTYTVLFCSMKKGGTWLQLASKKEIENPYYGENMKRCGSWIKR